MDAKPLSIGSILRERQRFVVPIYQRTYAWTVKKQLVPFLQQVEAKSADRLNGKRSPFSHYMGALLVIPEGDAVFGRVQTFNVVDGQQRLMTFHLFYAALREFALSIGLTEIARTIADLLVQGDDTPMQDRRNERYKLQPTRYDRSLFRDLINLDRETIRTKYAEHFYKTGNVREKDVPLPLHAWWFFRTAAEQFVGEGEAQGQRLLTLSTALFEDFRLIVITLAKDDDAQVIFQTLNTGGEPLSAMDLVRNDVFHRALSREENLEELMEERWALFEQPFWKQQGVQGRITKPRIDFFLAHTLTASGDSDVSLSELYVEYKSFVADQQFRSTDQELEFLTRHAPTYRALVEAGGNNALARLARRLKIFDVSTAYPLVFVIAASAMTDHEKEQAYTFIASYVIRRALCMLTPKNYNNVFAALASAVAKSVSPFATLIADFGGLTGEASRFPTDEELRGAIVRNRQYGYVQRRRLHAILAELELASRDRFDEATGLREDLQIEHVLPDEWTEHWPLYDGRFAPRDLVTGVDEKMREAIQLRETVKHTLGNLSLLTPPKNGQLGKAPFEQKRAWFRESLLKMNQEIAEETTWNEAAILQRAIRLAERARVLWPAPITTNSQA